MHKDPLSPLRSLYTRSGLDPHWTETVLEPLAPLIALTWARPFHLEREPCINEEEMRAALSAATGCDAERIAMISLEETIRAHPERFSGKGKEAKRSVIESLDGQRKRFRGILKERLGPLTTPYDHWNQGRGADALASALTSAGFNTDFKGALNAAYGRAIAGEVQNALWTCAFYHTLFGLVRDRAGLEATTSAVTLASQAVPLGEARNAPRTWVALVG